jgi:hypothetical protein
MMRVLSDVIEESIQNLTRTMVPREDAERANYTQKVDFTKLRSELLQADSTETQLTKSSHERLANDLTKLNNRLRDEVGRTQASVRLDLNLEKGRIREEANVQELKIKETEARIEQEVAGLKERIEGVKFSTLQWLVYVAVGHTLSNRKLISSQRFLHRYSSDHIGCLASIDVDIVGYLGSSKDWDRCSTHSILVSLQSLNPTIGMTFLGSPPMSPDFTC